MRIAIDLHGCYMLDCDFWDDFIRSARGKGHEIVVATGGYPDQPRHEGYKRLEALGIQVYWCQRRPKRAFLAQKGVKIDVWIDDNPLKIVKGGVGA